MSQAVSNAQHPDQPSRWLRVLGPLLLVLVIAFCVWTGYCRAHGQVNFAPSDGTFQSYNAVERLALGQRPARDFPAYIGLGPITIDWLSAALTRGRYADWLFAAVTVRSLLVAFALTLVGCLSGLRWQAALGLAPLLWLQNQLIEFLFAGTHQTPFAALDNSAITLRSLAPCLLAAAILCKRPATLVVWQEVLRWGLGCGLCLAWSNDYGIPTLIAATLVLLLYPPQPQLAWRTRLLIAGLSASLACAAAAALVWLATGDLAAWWDYNFHQVAPHQKRYFYASMLEKNRTLTLADLPWAWLLLFAALLGALHQLRRWSDVRIAPRYTALILIVLACTGAGYLTALGGYGGNRYFIPLTAYGIAALPGLAATYFALRRRPGANTLIDRGQTLLTALGCLVLCGLATVDGVHLAHEAADDCRIDVPELGCSMNCGYDRMLAVGRYLKADCAARQLPIDQQLLSTYRSGLAVVAGSQQPTRFDYLIHTVSPQNQQRFVDDFRRVQPLYVDTLRPTAADQWEGWTRNANWPFYHELLQNYRPLTRTHSHVVWQRQSQPNEPLGGRVLVEPRESTDNAASWQLSYVPPEATADLPMGTDDRAEVLVQVQADFVLQQRGAAWLRGAFAELAIWDVPDLHGGTAVFATEIAAGKASFSAVLKPGTVGMLRFRVLPPSAIRLERCTVSAAPLVTADVLRGRPQALFVPSATWNTEYTAGIASSLEQPAAFIVREPDDVANLQPGNALQFEHSGQRRVTGSSNGRIVVSGGPLDPQGDGFPHVIRRVQNAAKAP